jgi:hypothetical protein
MSKTIDLVVAALNKDAVQFEELFKESVASRVTSIVEEATPEIVADLVEASAFSPDYKAQSKSDVSPAGFRSKKVSTGTVYNRELGKDNAGEDTMKGSARKGVAFRKWNLMKKEDVDQQTEGQIDEAGGAFDADYKAQSKSDVSPAGFRSKKTSTGTVYNRELGKDNAGEDTMKGSARKGVAFRKWNLKKKD